MKITKKILQEIIEEVVDSTLKEQSKTDRATRPFVDPVGAEIDSAIKYADVDASDPMGNTDPHDRNRGINIGPTNFMDNLESAWSEYTQLRKDLRKRINLIDEDKLGEMVLKLGKIEDKVQSAYIQIRNDQQRKDYAQLNSKLMRSGVKRDLQKAYFNIKDAYDILSHDHQDGEAPGPIEGPGPNSFRSLFKEGGNFLAKALKSLRVIPNT